MKLYQIDYINFMKREFVALTDNPEDKKIMAKDWRRK